MASGREPDQTPETQQGDACSTGIALRLDCVIAVDHDAGTVELRGDSDAAIDSWCRRHSVVLERLGMRGGMGGAGAMSVGRSGAEPGAATGPESGPEFGPEFGPELGPDSSAARASLHEPTGGLAWRSTDDDYLARIDACLRAIRDGDAYVLCLTDTLEGTARGGREPLDVFDRLRAAGPAIRGGVIVAGDRALVSASPERFLSVSGREIRTDPIKGTRPRDPDPVRDDALAAELASDPKEAAENLMIVDLMRNDLGRVCAPGSVRVEGFLRVESHPHVHQLVSTIAGRLAGENTVLDALTTCFPGGSMTGAPKRRAVEILAGLEDGPRGLYSGCFGWIDDSGDAELAMTIRSVELRGERILIGAGGGITADSAPLRELDEKHLKARSLVAALRGDSAAE
ncbi:anthranilate synthase component I family protein [Leucobacter sp. CSA2]|uniref:Anthranilate synthase component I family protein n=2 Tax=Leucobacter edaphi TaxID=2796472 RepID=A0A934QBL5_9MICO|nr:anthranilate synthase component I family protein [Leucobacter edaphi]